MTPFDAPAKQTFWKQWDTVVSTQLDNFVRFFKIVVCKLFQFGRV